MVARWEDLVTQLGFGYEEEPVGRFTLVWTDQPVPKAQTLGLLDR
jgi:hypothetical protein